MSKNATVVRGHLTSERKVYSSSESAMQVSSTTLSTKSVDIEKATDQKKAGILFSFGSMLFLFLTTASEAMYPSFSLQTNAISDLAAVGARTWILEEVAILG